MAINLNGVKSSSLTKCFSKVWKNWKSAVRKIPCGQTDESKQIKMSSVQAILKAVVKVGTVLLMLRMSILEELKAYVTLNGNG